MNPFKDLKDMVAAELDGLARDGVLPAGLDTARVTVEPPRDPAHGDVATNAAMVLAKPAAKKPRELAEALAERLGALEPVTQVEIAGPGFINLTLAPAFWHGCLAGILRAGADYGRSDLGGGTLVNVEYVSTNPTGPLTVGHARGAVVGDALAALFEKVGYRVTREYYINDAGAQLEALARSVYYRYREAWNVEPNPVPDGFYPGEYLIAVGEALKKEDGARWLDVEEAPKCDPTSGWREACANFGRDEMMKLIKDDLGAVGIKHAVFTSERSLHQKGEGQKKSKVEEAFDVLQSKGLIYWGKLEAPKGKLPEDWEPREQWLFRATEFGDDVDRPLRKSDGTWTYFASDMAYHLDKFRRGARLMIDVWGSGAPTTAAMSSACRRRSRR
jgi:arginyl-tRNA synthetase